MSRKHNGIRIKFLVISMLVFILSFAAGWFAINSYSSLLKQQHRVSLERELSSKAGTLTQTIQHRFSLLYGIRAFILANSEQFDSKGFSSDPDGVNHFLYETYVSLPDIREVTISPGGTHRYVYPINESTEKTLGHNLLTDHRPVVREKVQRTIKSRKIGLSGPYLLRQDGSLGLVARLPIYRADKFWGFAIMVLNVPKMLAAAGIEHPDEFALRVAKGDLFWGNPDSFGAASLLVPVSLPDGQWELTISSVPLGLTTNQNVTLFLLNVIFALLTSSLYFVLSTRRWYLQTEVLRATKELRKQDLALLESESRYRSLFENNHSIMLLIDPKTGSIVDANPPACDYYGYAKEELMRMKISDINQLSEQQIFEKMGSVKNDQRNCFHFKHRLASGELRDVEVYSGSLQIKGEQLLYSIIYDITERKLAEDELRETEERFRLIFKMSPDPVIIARLDNGTIIDVNGAFETSTGITSLKAIGQILEDLDLWIDSGEGETFREQLQREGVVNNWEVDFRLLNGETRAGMLSSRQVKLQNTTCILLVVRDVTTERAAERALMEFSQAKSEFISMAAHELRTPLAAMMGFTEFLLAPEEFGGFSEEQKSDFLKEVYDRGESLSRIIDDLLDISRIERGLSVTLDLQQTDFKKLLTKTVESYRVHNSEHEFRLDLLSEPEQSMMFVDRHRINQVIENLLSNAVKYSPKGKEILVKGRSVLEGWEVRVEDQGVGMTPDQVEKVFDKFFRADSSNSAVQGLGLGMSIVKQIIDAHGGSVRVESAKGRGAAVTFTLPRTAE